VSLRISGEHNIFGILFLVETVISELISPSSHVSQSEQALATFLAWISLALFKEKRNICELSNNRLKVINMYTFFIMLLIEYYCLKDPQCKHFHNMF